MGDVLLAGPAVRALEASAAEVTMLVGPAGRAAARRLPGVARVLIARLPWIDAEPLPVDRAGFERLVDVLAGHCFDGAVLLTSFHQNPLPLALACKLAGIPKVAAISEDYPGSLLDIRHHVREDIHEVVRNLSLVNTFGARLPADDDARLAIVDDCLPARGVHYVLIHPGATSAARTLSADQWRAVVEEVAAAGSRVLVTGSKGDTKLTAAVTANIEGAVNLGGATDFDAMTSLVAGADAVVVGNTGPAHLAAAVGTPVVSVFAPTVPSERWRPWMVPHVLLGNQDVACRGCRARVCPLESQRCLASITPDDVLGALVALRREVEIAV
jgi:ADP-heptose:LPS heptosyltransferase